MYDSNLTIPSAIDSTLSPSEARPYSRENELTSIILSPLRVGIITFGLIANIINIAVFLKARIKDSVTVLLFSLAISDLIFLCLVALQVYGTFLKDIIPSFRSPLDLKLLVFLLYWPAYTAYDLSTFISVSLGVMRCACVAVPLKFKFVFTNSRTIIWVIFLAVLAVALRVPVLSIYRLAWKIDPASNTSAVYLKHVNRASMSRINDIMNRGIIIYITYVTMVACVLILIYKLYEASKIRRSSTADQSSDKTVDKGLSSKDLQVVKSVVLICIIFILSQLFFLVVSSARLLVPEFQAGGGFEFLFGLFSQANQTSSYLNASVNIFVYYKFNSKFRSVFNSLFFKSKH